MSPAPTRPFRRAAALLALAGATTAAACRELAFEPQDPRTVAYADSLRIDLAAYQRTPNGVYYRDVAVGSGTVVESTSTVGVIYRGFLASGYVFSPAPTQAVTFNLAQALPGFQGFRDGLLGARGNSRRLLIVPPSQGFGNRTAGNNKIPAGSVLLFDVNISSVTTPPPPATTRAPR